MKKTIIGGLLGGAVLFLWGWLAWLALPLHEASMRPLPSDEPVVAALQASIPEKGFYVFPAMPKGASDAQMEVWKQKYQRGPVGAVIFSPSGGDPMMTSQIAPGLLINLLAGLLAAWFLSRSTAVASGYLARVAYCGMLGIFISLTTYAMMWNWMGFPPDFTAAMIADALLGWILAGLAIAAIVKSPPAPQPA